MPPCQFTPPERRLIARLRTPLQVQRWLNALPYNAEPGGETQRSFRSVVALGTAHCMEAAMSAATILETHGWPPLVMSLESEDKLDHVVFVYRTATGWGSIARSRDPGLHGRRPVFRTLRDLACSYIEPYIDVSGRITGYGVLDLRELGPYDWRCSPRNLWHVEQVLRDLPHRAIRSSDTRIARLRERYHAFMAAHPGFKPLYYGGQDRWHPLPAVFAPSVRLARQACHQSKSNARSGRLMGSFFACSRASRNRRSRSSPRFFSAWKDCSNNRSRAAASSASSRWASSISRTGPVRASLCDTTRLRFTSTTSSARQHGQWTVSSDARRLITLPPGGTGWRRLEAAPPGGAIMTHHGHPHDPPARRLRLATYNIHKCRGMDGRTRVDRIASVLGHLDADVMALQEVWGAGPEEDGQAAALGAALGMGWVMDSVRLLRGQGRTATRC